MRIAVLDDDHVQLQSVDAILTSDGFRPTVFSRTALLIAALRRDTFDLLVVDWNLPERSGLEAIEWTRANLTPSPPILLLTSRSDDEDIVAGLNAGADDYLVKPAHPAVLLARIRALLRRSSPTALKGARSIALGGAVFDPLNSAVAIGETTAVLTAKEYALTLLLFQNINRALSRSYIVAAIWGAEPDVTSRTLDMHISRIRNKLELKPVLGYRIAPVYSYGYRLEHVETVGSGQAGPQV